MEVRELADGVYAAIRPDLGLGWSNSGFVTGGGGLVIDSFYDVPTTTELRRRYAEVGPESPRRLLNTHHNGDHCWGNQVFEEAEILGHRLCAENMTKEVGPDVIQAMLQNPDSLPPFMRMLGEAFGQFDFTGIELRPPTTFIDERLDLDLGGTNVELHYVGPAHTGGDVVAWLPEERIVFCGDILFHQCTPIGWDGTFDGWTGALDRIVGWHPEVVVPGHGPVCGVAGLLGLRDYLLYVRDQAYVHWEAGRPVLDACKQIDLGPFGSWNEPWRLPFQVSRAYHEFDGGRWDESVDALAIFELCYELREHMTLNRSE
jgi:cyclase